MAPTTRCVVSDRFRFICLLIAKNASSTLRTELAKPAYGGRELVYDDIDEESRKSYFTFAFLRDPITRLLSAYQEVSLRHEMGEALNRGRAFFSMGDTPQRFRAFLDEVARHTWDPHLWRQSDHLSGVRVDFLGSVERFQDDIEEVFRHLGLPTCPTFAARRSRKERKEKHRYAKFLLREEDLDTDTVRVIERIYTADLQLYADSILRQYARSGRLLRLWEEADAERQGYVIYQLGRRGFYAELASVVRAMVYALGHGARFALDSTSFSFRHREGWADYFEEFCPRLGGGLRGEVREYCHGSYGGPGTAFFRMRRFEPPKLVLGGVPIRGYETVMSVLLRMIFRPQPALLAEERRLLAQLGLPTSYAAVHIRRGDKVGDEDVFYPAALYAEKVRDLGAGDLPLFVMSDDYAAVEEMRSHLSEQGDSRRIYTLCEKKHAGFDQGALERGERWCAADGDTPQTHAEMRDYAHAEGVRLIIETMIARDAAAFVSTRKSNVGTAIRFLHDAPARVLLMNPGDAAARGRTSPPLEEGGQAGF